MKKTIIAAAIAIFTIATTASPAFGAVLIDLDENAAIPYDSTPHAWDGVTHFRPDRENRICIKITLTDSVYKGKRIATDATVKFRVEVVADNQRGSGFASDSRTWTLANNGIRDCPFRTMRTPGTYHLRYRVQDPNLRLVHKFQIKLEADPAG
jgi:hypothetical protein